jgi:hypothetical protein
LTKLSVTPSSIRRAPAAPRGAGEIPGGAPTPGTPVGACSMPGGNGAGVWANPPPAASVNAAAEAAPNDRRRDVKRGVFNRKSLYESGRYHACFATGKWLVVMLFRFAAH